MYVHVHSLNVCCPLLCRFTDRLNISYTVEAERFTGKAYSRATFNENRGENPHIIEKEITLNEQTNNNYKCRYHDVNILVSVSGCIVISKCL